MDTAKTAASSVVSGMLAVLKPSLAVGVPVYIGYTFFKKRVRMLGKDEQLFVESPTEMKVIDGPKVAILPLIMKSEEVKKAMTLTKLQYVVVKNSLTGKLRIEKGPQLLFMKPYDEVHGGVGDQISLKKNEFVRFASAATGEIRVVKGECGGIVPEPEETMIDKGKQVALDLKVFQYVNIEDKRTGEKRVERGPNLVFLGPFEETIPKTGNRVQSAIEVDEQTAVLVRNKSTGQESLVTEKQLFFPKPFEEILEARSIILLADFEACVVRGKDGTHKFHFGKAPKSNPQAISERAFFLEPYSELVTLCWSRGRRRERRDLLIMKIDMRPMYMSFEFACRTIDNVELVLEGTFFWEITDVEAMVVSTGDTTGDICNHARSKFIESVSKVTLQEFMSDVNGIGAGVLAQSVSGSDNFYKQRGCQIHSLEVTGYRCADSKTQNILTGIIEETTNRMNALQKQKSENEVNMHRISGDIEKEKAQGDLLDIQTINIKKRNEMEGLGEAEKVKSFLSGLKTELPDVKDRIQAWQTLRKREALGEVANGKASAKLFFTPKDANLSIEDHAHAHEGY